MNKILVICGPTATGKTQLGFEIAKTFLGEIISSDSRQVYKYMDIGTGKEWDTESGANAIPIYGYDIVDPKEIYSVYDYFLKTKPIIENIWSRNKLPIIVGGTGLYIKSLIDGIQTIDIPQNKNLRESLEKMSTEEMFEKLAILDSSKAGQMNLSDKKNPRRLVRAIEVAVWNIENSTKKKLVENRKNILDDDIDVLMIGLTSSNENLKRNIARRVESRINHGFIEEVEMLLKMGVNWKHQSMKSLGYREAESFFKNGLSYEEFVNKWVSSEVKYVKRQLTWFKKETYHNGKKRINWFDINKGVFPENVVSFINKWYSTSR